MQDNGVYYPISIGTLEITKPNNFTFCNNSFKPIYDVDINFKLNEFNEKYHIEIPYENGEVTNDDCNNSVFILTPKNKYLNTNFEFSFDKKNWNEKPPFTKQKIFGNSKTNKKLYIRNKKLKSEVIDLNIEYIESNIDFNLSSSFQKIKDILSKDEINFKDEIELSNLANEIEKVGGKIDPTMTEIIATHTPGQKYTFTDIVVC